MMVQRALSKQATEINAVHPRDADALLAQLGLSLSYANGDLACAICGHPVNERGPGAVSKIDGQVRVACAALDCVRRFA
jgi:5-methylcytosine-specific restriction endonuclease McrA